MDQPSIKMKKPGRKIESIRIWGETLSLSLFQNNLSNRFIPWNPRR